MDTRRIGSEQRQTHGWELAQREKRFIVSDLIRVFVFGIALLAYRRKVNLARIIYWISQSVYRLRLEILQIYSFCFSCVFMCINVIKILQIFVDEWIFTKRLNWNKFYKMSIALLMPMISLLKISWNIWRTYLCFFSFSNWRRGRGRTSWFMF